MRGLLKAPAVGRLWLAGISAGVVRWLEMLAYSLWVFAETGSPLAVTLTAFARMLPLLLLGALSGAVAERLDRRRLLCGWYVLLTITAAGLALLATVHALTVPMVAAYALFTGLFWTFETPVRRTMLAEAAGLARVNASMGLEMTSSQVSRLVGPALGGWLMASAGVTGVFLAGSCSMAWGRSCCSGCRAQAARRRGPSSANLGRPAGRRLASCGTAAAARRHRFHRALQSLVHALHFTGPVGRRDEDAARCGPDRAADVGRGHRRDRGSLWVATLAPPPWFALCYSLGAIVSAAGVLLFTWTSAPWQASLP